MGCCLNPIAPKSQPSLDYASLEERNIGLHQIPLQMFIQTLRATSITDTITPNNLKTVFQEGRWKEALSGDSMAIFILTHPSLLTSDEKVHKHSIIALGLLYARASPNIRANIFLLEAQNQDILKSMAGKMLTIAARVVPLYLEGKKVDVEKVASQDEIGLVLQEFMEEALGPYKSYSYKGLARFMNREGGYILSPEKIRQKFSVKYFNELVGTRDEDGADDQEEEKEEDKKSQKLSHKSDEEKKSEKAESEKIESEKAESEKAESEKVESQGKPEEEKKEVESESEDDDDDEEEVELDDTGVVVFDLAQLKKEKIPRTKCPFNAYIDHQFNQEKCCDITHTIGFLYLEKLVRLAKYAWKRSNRYWQPMGTIFQKLIALLEGGSEASQKMDNLHKFLHRYFKSEQQEQVFKESQEKQTYGAYVQWLNGKFEEVETVKEKNKIAQVAIKALNNQPDNLRSACSETNRNVIRKHVDTPYDGSQIQGLRFVEYFVECCAAMKELIPEASDYIKHNILETALNPVISEDKASVISSKECEQEPGHDKELKSQHFIPLELFKEVVEKAELKYGEALKIAALQDLKAEVEEEEKEESEKAPSEKEEEKEEKQEKEEEEGSEKKEESDIEVPEVIEEVKIKEPVEIEFSMEHLKFQKIPRSQCAFNAYIEHQFDQETCCDITHTIGFSYLQKLVRLAKWAWKESGDVMWQPMGVIFTKHIDLIVKEHYTEERMSNLHNFFDNYIKADQFQELFQKSKEENDYTEYSNYVVKQLQNVPNSDQIDDIAKLAIKALNNYPGNLRSACSETNRNVIRKHVDLPYDGEKIEGVNFIEYFVECCAELKKLIPCAAEYIKANILQKALNGVVSEDQTTIISSKWCELEQGHDKELRSELFIPGQLYKDLVKKAEEIYGEALEVEAVKELKEELEVENVEEAEEKDEEYVPEEETQADD